MNNTKTELKVRSQSSDLVVSWSAGEDGPFEIDIVDDPLQPVEFCSDSVISIQMRTSRVKVSSYWFDEDPLAMAVDAAARNAEKNPTVKSNQLSAESELTTKRDKAARSRITPPKDMIKLKDRLFYVLQPPLEALTGTIEFPFRPFPYQYEGIAYLFPCHSAVLADEMGLGKTMQAISTIRLLLHARELRNVLIICPKPLVSNWVREFKLWAPEIPVEVVEGGQHKRHWQWQSREIAVKIANYELISRDHNIVADAGLEFDLVVLDEAQRIKNTQSTISKVVRSIPRTRSWALTGTPVENSTSDIVGIFEFVSKGLLTNAMSPRQVAVEVKDHILRRTKDMVMKDMPPRLERDAELDLTSQQLATYCQAEDEGVFRLNEMGDEITIQHVFELVLRLKQICNFDPATNSSCKMERLSADLEEVAASGNKAIVFSQWVKSLDQIGQQLAPYNPLAYHGKIPSRRRDAVLQEFKENPERTVLLMSYGAGSVGLNLQFCRYVFLFDRWWNPAVEDQAINRAHRIGVAGSVTVTRMLTLNTIEERINEVLEQKRELFRSILSETGPSQRAGLSREDVFGLFDLRITPPAKPNAA
ncbi:DEAD/DEAH box helicase [Vicingaceae bacterium]|nr:DEAD/DEAH box helicase [Vicingaceae bacterium]